MKECCKTYLDGQFGGDAAVIAEIYEEYVNSVKTKLVEAKDALANGDWGQLDRVAHAIKGNALAAGDGDMAQTAIDLRSAAQLQDAAAVSGLVARIVELAGAL